MPKNRLKSKKNCPLETSKKKDRKKKPQRKLNTRKEYNIPKEKLEEVLSVVHQEIECTKASPENKCSVLIQQISPNIRHSYRSIILKLLEEARLCLLQRDWKNLANILIISKPSSKKEHTLYFQVFVRYAVICLAHNPDEKLFNMFLEGVASCSGDVEKNKFLKSLTSD